MLFLYILLFILVIVLDYYIAKQFESAAADKGYADSKYFHMCFWLGLVGYLLVIALPDRKRNSIREVAPPRDTNHILPTEPQPENIPATTDTFTPVDTAYAIPVGETNIRCANCNRIQFKGNTVCIQCKAKLVKPN